MGLQNLLSPLIPITDPGAGSAVQDPCKTESLCWRLEHLSQSMQSFSAHPLSLGLIRTSHQVSNGVRVKERDRGNLWPSHPLGYFHGCQFWFGVREGMLGAYCWLLQLVSAGGWATFPWFPLDWFKVLAGLGHSWTIWPQPWHLKHWREQGFLLLAVPPCLSLAPWLFCPWSLLVVVPALWLKDVLWTKAVWPRPVWLLWELGWPGVLLSVHPLPWPLCLGLFGALAGLLPCPALVRVAINLAIWYPNSVVLSTGSVVTADLALTLLWASSFSLSALWAAIINWE